MNKVKLQKKLPTQLGEVKKENKTSFKALVATLSRGLMLPIAMLPIAGLFLGIGATITSQISDTASAGYIIGNILTYTGNVVFTLLPLMFCVAIAIAFTHDAGAAGLSAMVSLMVFYAFEMSLIIKHDNGQTSFLWYTYGPGCGIFTSDMYNAIFANVLGFDCLSTSVFGGIVIGCVVAYLYNRFKDIQLPKVLGFFNGVRFVPIVSFLAGIAISFIFSMLWPVIGLGIYYAGEGLTTIGAFGGTFFYGFLNRCLVPFGLHHVVNTMMWFSTVGGTFDTNQIAQIAGQPVQGGLTWAQIANDSTAPIVTGDINIQIYLIKIIGQTVTLSDGSTHLITVSDVVNGYSGGSISPGQYTNFAYVFTLFALPAAALAMLYAAPKGDNRKVAASIVISAAFTCFLTGITEPIEFTFLFLAPWLFWGFHACMSGIAAAVTTVISHWAPSFGPHVGFAFSSGLLDFSIYGIIPDVRGGGTNCWMLPCLSLVYAPIYFFVFYWAIKKFDIATPGRGGNTKLFSKADWVKAKDAKTSSKDQVSVEKANQVIKAYGGVDNIKSVDACMTKLRINVSDAKKVDEAKLKQLGAMGVTHPAKNTVYAVFGFEADLLKNKIKQKMKEK